MSPKTFFTSDLHLGHSLVSELRGFSSTEDHDEAIMDTLKSSVRRGDVLWILGDICVGNKSDTIKALSHISDLKNTTGITIHFIAGNHDSIHPMHRGAQKHFAQFAAVFDSIGPFARRRFDGRSAWMSHFPFHGSGDRDERDEERGRAIRIHDDGESLLIHGHLHGENPISGERSVDVGLDGHSLTPWGSDELTQLIKDNFPR